MRTLTGLAAWLLGAMPLGAQERSAADIIREHDAVKFPGFLKMPIEEYEKLVHTASEQQIDLAKELWEKHPNHPEVVRLVGSRWTLMVNVFEQYAEVLSETAEVLEQHEGAFRKRAHLNRAHAVLRDHSVPIEDRFRWVKEAIHENPEETGWCASFLVSLALDHVANPKKQRALCEQVLKRYPRADSAIEARQHLELLKWVGQHIDVPYVDHRSANPIDQTRYAGKKRLIHLWMGPAWTLRDPVSRLQELHRQGIPIFGVPIGFETEAEARQVVQELEIEWPLLATPPKDENGKRPPGLRRPVILLLSSEGKLLAATRRPEPLATALGKTLR